ncbi:NrdB protein [Synechococcus phage S-CBM2]|nr:NrdB protein [Synechococcus phage S-CBM2]
MPLKKLKLNHMSLEALNRMSKQIPSQDLNYEVKFEHQWGGEDTWYTKAVRWANKHKFPINYIALGVIEWLHEQWIDGKVEMEMASVDRQAQEIVKQWEEEDELTRRKPIVEEGVSGVDGLPSLRITKSLC